ncbi:hypothetical protein DICPUDRAFT_92555 [Dictyostelium purpureum]|uniref:DUF4359 domain-containing protein n=1 Tax=Dictyostelium purpureum TaxID=5786 RepID=F0ZTP5_DICPU|nr:uncharacterized protein DICPUDRAFT_92555 [Dictyostelium purpureum]EGC32681.1 hypothetical protein DICPUDRAFT_92555 [Dictyostelium purpureum]|eukprot:XP_003290784.1 hypothetical protein DICPUDRAFT_92555 [Dictyostelium purpureum]
MKKLLFLLAGIGIFYATNPDEKQFKEQIRKYSENNNGGYLAGLVMRGIVALNAFKIKNLGVLSLAYLNDPQKDQPQLVAFGLLGKWFFNSNKL